MKNKPFKVVFDVGDAAQHYYADVVMPQSQHQSAPPLAQMVNERLDHLQRVMNNIDERLNDVILREEHLAHVE